MHLYVISRYKYIKNSFVDDPLIQQLKTPGICGMAATGSCSGTVAAWTVGLNGECSHGDFRYKIGAGSYKYIILEVNLILKTFANCLDSKEHCLL